MQPDVGTNKLSGCFGKQRLSREVAQGIVLRDHQGGRGVSRRKHADTRLAYRCKYCGHWHVGESDRARQMDKQSRRERREQQRESSMDLAAALVAEEAYLFEPA